MKELKGGDFENLPCEPREHMLAIALEADEVVIAEGTVITDWWVFEVSPSRRQLAYFGTPETLKAWKLSEGVLEN